MRTARCFKFFYYDLCKGDRILWRDIKAKIGEIYNKLNYPVHPKATEIKDWFEVSKVKITSSLSGFKLIKRRF